MIKYQESEEMYLETILLLKRKIANVHAINVAEELGYSKPSVSRGMGLLVKKGFITVGSNGEINFTAAGKKKAEDIYERHTVITKLLQYTGANLQTAEENACRIEHVITPELFKVLKKFTKEVCDG
ncbi:MAG: metal-dependent transcriptional regulator [Bacteroides sp.]|nr:metal-dependent transcriptional regulator [Bacillota bacterium]MCM1394485.1 metal-dependent transcriptional regulator [[Eubacterium] siraeum]MCM1455317.1 metal-dependent transcriptional regulator [Bacteroides sp.]